MLEKQEHERRFFELGIIKTYFTVLDSDEQLIYGQIYQIYIRGWVLPNFVEPFTEELTAIKSNKY